MQSRFEASREISHVEETLAEYSPILTSSALAYVTTGSQLIWCSGCLCEFLLWNSLFGYGSLLSFMAGINPVQTGGIYIHGSSLLKASDTSGHVVNHYA